MKPVAIFRHSPTEGPAYFATWLERRALPSRLVALDAGEAVPKDARAFSGLVFMGGPMSVNDPLPWIAPVLELIRDAVRKDVPTLGHCLGGQLMSKAFGGSVGRTPVAEIGWGEVSMQDNAVARDWFGEVGAFETFQWHYETFTIPPGATRVASSAHCPNQGFALGKHLGLQCHVEMTQDLIDTWCRSGADEIREASASAGVQQVAEIKRDIDARVENLHKVADRIYDRWSQGLAKS
jgi:GMP synthase-like glutamine amidotransferase